MKRHILALFFAILAADFVASAAVRHTWYRLLSGSQKPSSVASRWTRQDDASHHFERVATNKWIESRNNRPVAEYTEAEQGRDAHGPVVLLHNSEADHLILLTTGKALLGDTDTYDESGFSVKSTLFAGKWTLGGDDKTKSTESSESQASRHYEENVSDKMKESGSTSRWVFEKDPSGSYFERRSAEDWIEVQNGKLVANFKHVSSSSPTSVVLKRPDGLYVHLDRGSMMFGHKPNEIKSYLRGGRWTTDSVRGFDEHAGAEHETPREEWDEDEHEKVETRQYEHDGSKSSCGSCGGNSCGSHNKVVSKNEVTTKIQTHEYKDGALNKPCAAQHSTPHKSHPSSDYHIGSNRHINTDERMGWGESRMGHHDRVSGGGSNRAMANANWCCGSHGHRNDYDNSEGYRGGDQHGSSSVYRHNGSSGYRGGDHSGYRSKYHGAAGGYRGGDHFSHPGQEFGRQHSSSTGSRHPFQEFGHFRASPKKSSFH